MLLNYCSALLDAPSLGLAAHESVLGTAALLVWTGNTVT